MSAGSVVTGLITSGMGLPTVDMQPLLDTINSAGNYQRTIINGLPPEIRKNLAQYAASLGEGADKYQSAIKALGTDMQQQAGTIYGPNSDAAKLALDSSKKEIYSTVPGTQNAIRNALAATGGLGRGQAASSLAQPYMQAAQDYSKASSGILADQASKGQAAQMKALEAVTSMNDSMFQNLFGMSKQQAQQILTSGNTALSDQLAALIAQNNNQTNQTLGVQGIQANNGYQNAVTRSAQNNAIIGGLVDLGIGGMDGMGGGSAMPEGAI